MPLIKHDGQDYAAVKKELTKRDDKYAVAFFTVTAILGKFWTEMLTVSEERVLTFLVCRTLLYRKRGEAIPHRHFIEGIEGVCGPAGVSKNTVRLALTSLSAKGFITIHAFFSNKAETVWRVYEVNTLKITANRDVTGVYEMGKRLSGMAETTPSTGWGTPSQPLGDRTSLLRNEHTTTNVVVSAASLPTPKKPRMGVAVNCNRAVSPQELVNSISARSTATRATRVAKSVTVPVKRWQTNDLQALLDQARQRCAEQGYTVPRVIVVAKTIGVLHKRLLAADIGNPLDFFVWALQNWSTVAGANRSAKARQAREEKKVSSAMLNVPNFNDLAYRCPYILAFYNEREHTKATEIRAKTQQIEKEQETAARVARATQTRKELVRQKDLERERVLQAEDQETTATVRRRVSRTQRRLPADDAIPEFRDNAWGDQ